MDEIRGIFPQKHQCKSSPATVIPQYKVAHYTAVWDITQSLAASKSSQQLIVKSNQKGKTKAS